MNKKLKNEIKLTMSVIAYTKVIRKGELCSPCAVENVPNGHSYFVHEEDLDANGDEFLVVNHGFSHQEVERFRKAIESSSDDVYMAKRSLKVTVELLDETPC